jgi:hypothetical protein
MGDPEVANRPLRISGSAVRQMYLPHVVGVNCGTNCDTDEEIADVVWGIAPSAS